MDKIEELLTRGVDKIYPSKEDLEKVLKSGKKLKLYQGFDPTGTQLHIGHMIGLKKLRQWQELGHHVIFLIGDGTGQAGDPSGKHTARDRFLSREELRKNAIDYVKQAENIVRFDGDNPAEILFNGDWLNSLNLLDILDIAGRFSLQQLSERDLFQERMKKGQQVNLREFLYPLLQAYDSVAMSVDLEIGGSDQTFNMLAGRTLVRSMQNREKFVMTTPLLTDTEGRKIGKTEGNVIALNDSPRDLYARIMALSDDVIVKSLEYLTDLDLSEIEKISQSIKGGENPIKHKKLLSYEIVKQIHGYENANKAQIDFEGIVQNKQLSEDLVEKEVDEDTIIDENFLVELGFASSKSEAKRLFDQGGVKLDGEKVNNGQAMTEEDGEIRVLSVGRKMVKLKTKPN